MTPKSWTAYAAAALAKEQGRWLCNRTIHVREGDRLLHRFCTLRAGHEGAHR